MIIGEVEIALLIAHAQLPTLHVSVAVHMVAAISHRSHLHKFLLTGHF